MSEVAPPTPPAPAPFAPESATPAPAARRRTPSRGLRRMATHRQVAVLVGLIVVLGLTVIGVGYWRLLDVGTHVDRARSEFTPAANALTRTQDHWTQANALIAKLAAGDTSASGATLDQIQEAQIAWTAYTKVARGLPGEDALREQYESIQTNLTAAINALSANTANPVAAVGTLSSVISSFAPPLGSLRSLYANGITTAVEAARASVSVAEKDTILSSGIAFVVVLIASGFVFHMLRQREREIAERDHERAHEVRRSDIETRLQRALELVRTEEASYRLIERAMITATPDVPIELLVADSSRAHFHRAAASTTDTPGCPVSAPMDCPATTRGQTQIWPSSADLDACPYLEASVDADCSAVCLPMSIAGKTVGVFHMTGPNYAPPPRSVIDDLELVSRKAGERIGMLRAFSRSETQAKTDPLTGLLNRRSLESQLTELIDEGHAYIIAFGDLDNFKLLNDVHGHDSGDRALRLFARVVRDNLRPNDIAARYGGEEFVVVLPDCSIADAYAVLERMRDRLASSQHEGHVPPFTVSFGIAPSRADTTFTEVISSADAALLNAKTTGRDRIVIAAGDDIFEDRPESMAIPEPEAPTFDGSGSAAHSL